MKSRQVGFVLMALIAIGIAGLIFRVASFGSEELVLTGLLPLPKDVINKVSIRSDESEAQLVRISDAWRIGNHPVFQPALNRFWNVVEEIDGAQLIATNPVNHERMGVAKGQGTTVSFFLGGSVQEQFIVGKWTPEVGLCYLRRSGRDEVYGVPCPSPNIFDPNPDGWRNPLIVSIPRTEVESVSFTYPDEEFVLKVSEGDWIVESVIEEAPANFIRVSGILATLNLLLALGFADDDEAKGLKFDVPDASVRVVTRAGSTSPTTRLRFLRRDDSSYYVQTPAKPGVFIVDGSLADRLLLKKEDLLLGVEGP